MRQFTLTRSQCARLARLLHMAYTLRELAEEIGCSKRQLRTAITLGCPHRRTANNRLWIVGDAFRDWYHELVAERKTMLGPDEAYCLRCQAAVPLVIERVTEHAHGVERVTGTCPRCGATVQRFREARV